MIPFFERLKWIYQKCHLSTWMPFLALVGYTIFGGWLFRTIEMGPDLKRREAYRNRTNFAMQQVIDRMVEVKCHDPSSQQDHRLQEKHAKEAILWFLDHLNLTVVIEENTEESPWTWIGAMFYAGQLYTTIGYGVPTARTRDGQIATIFYILFGIPIFLIILKDMGRILSRSLRKIYKKMRSSKRKIAQATPLHRISLPVKTKDGVKSEKIVHIESPQFLNEDDKKMPKIETSFPISIALGILMLWIIFSASMFCIWEREWGFLTSVYFFFVSISTVGLGDIVFQKPEMMIYNFGLILVGLALLSMCFNLIQASIEKMLDRLLDEYIEEIEKMAEIVTNDDGLQEEAMPLELKMSGNLLTLPMKRLTNETGFFAEAKEWMAGRIANNLIASRLGNVTDDESDDELNCEDDEKMADDERLNVATVLAHDVVVQDHKGSRRTSHISCAPSEKSGSNKFSARIRHNRPLFNTIKTLEKIRPKNENFKSIIFSKFVQSEKLNKLIDDVAAEPKKVTTTSCQTDITGFVEERKTSRRKRHLRMDSNSSFSTLYTNSMLFHDDDSLMSAAFCDLRFDYSTECSPPSLHKNSSQSIYKIDDDDVMKIPPKINISVNPRALGLPPPPPPPVSRKPTVFNIDGTIQNQQQQQQQQQASSTLIDQEEDAEILMTPRRLASMTDIEPKKVRIEGDETLTKARTICGLLPQDFDSPSQSTTTSQIDSGYEAGK